MFKAQAGPAPQRMPVAVLAFGRARRQHMDKRCPHRFQHDDGGIATWRRKSVDRRVHWILRWRGHDFVTSVARLACAVAVLTIFGRATSCENH
jgi:hypothetical protein